MALLGATSPCGRQHRPSFIGTMIRELVRTPIIGRLCPSREPTAHLTLPVLKLPETLLAVVFSFSGLHATLNASLSCRPAFAQMWQSPLFWRTLLQALGVSDVALRAAGLEGRREEGRLGMAKALRDFARHWLLGISLLTGMPVHMKSCPDISALRLNRQSLQQNHSATLEDARRAVLAMRPEDGTALLQRAAESIAMLLSSRKSGESELLKAEGLLEAIANRSDIFTTGQMLDMLGAHQKADEDHDVLVTMPKRPTADLGTQQRHSSRRFRRNGSDEGEATGAVRTGSEVPLFPASRPFEERPSPSAAA